jgi:hypothetical protein
VCCHDMISSNFVFFCFLSLVIRPLSDNPSGRGLHVLASSHAKYHCDSCVLYSKSLRQEDCASFRQVSCVVTHYEDRRPCTEPRVPLC